MKILNIESKHQITEPIIQGNDVSIYLNETLKTVTKDDETYDVYLYDVVFVENGIFYSNVQLFAELFFADYYLKITDHKDLKSYVPKPNEDLESIIIKRNNYRTFIRENS